MSEKAKRRKEKKERKEEEKSTCTLGSTYPISIITTTAKTRQRNKISFETHRAHSKQHKHNTKQQEQKREGDKRTSPTNLNSPV